MAKLTITSDGGTYTREFTSEELPDDLQDALNDAWAEAEVADMRERWRRDEHDKTEIPQHVYAGVDPTCVICGQPFSTDDS